MHKLCSRAEKWPRAKERQTDREREKERASLWFGAICVYLFSFYILFISIFCPFVCDVCVNVAHFIAMLSYPLGCNFKKLHTLLVSSLSRSKQNSIYILCIMYSPPLFFSCRHLHRRWLEWL